MIRTKLRIWPSGKLVEQMTTEYDDEGNVISMWGMMSVPRVIYYQEKQNLVVDLYEAS